MSKSFALEVEATLYSLVNYSMLIFSLSIRFSTALVVIAP